MDAILSEASTSLRGFPPVPGPFLTFDMILLVFLHQEAEFLNRDRMQWVDGLPVVNF